MSRTHARGEPGRAEEDTIRDESWPGCWFINHDAGPALRNYWFLANSKRQAEPVIYASSDCAALVVTTVPLDAIREPHVMAWCDSFHPITVAELEAMALAASQLAESISTDPALADGELVA